MMHQHASTTSPDESPAAVLYERHAATIFAYLRLHAPSLEDAEDLLLEVFLAALETAYLFTLPEGQQLAWLRQVAHHKLVDHFRQAARRSFVALEPLAEVIEDDEEMTPEWAALRQEERRQLQEAVQHLPALQREVLRLRFGDGLRAAQIGTLLGKREEAVRKLLSRTLNSLRNFYRDHQGGARHDDTR